MHPYTRALKVATKIQKKNDIDKSISLFLQNILFLQLISPFFCLFSQSPLTNCPSGWLVTK